MNGMLFVIQHPDTGQPINHGIIAQQITPEKYLCQFRVPPVSSRVVPIEELQMYQLFHNQQQLDNFLAAMQQQKQPAKPPVAPPADPVKKKLPRGKKVAKKKKISKKKTSK